MKLQLQGLEPGEGLRRLTHALLRADIGGRINFDLQAEVLRLDSRLSLGDAVATVEGSGFKVLGVLDGTITDLAYRPR